MKPDWILGFEKFKDELVRFGQSDEAPIRYFFDGSLFVCVIISPTENFWLVTDPALIDELTINDIMDKGMEVKGLLNLNFHKDLLLKLDEVRNAATNTTYNTGNNN